VENILFIGDKENDQNKNIAREFRSWNDRKFLVNLTDDLIHARRIFDYSMFYSPPEAKFKLLLFNPYIRYGVIEKDLQSFLIYARETIPAVMLCTNPIYTHFQQGIHFDTFVSPNTSTSWLEKGLSEFLKESVYFRK
jgi:hypothetical protein